MSTWSRREFLRFMGLASGTVLLGTSLAACGRTQKKEAPLRIGYLPITDAGPLLIAHAQGYYVDEGIEVAPPTLFRSWSQIAEAFMAGQVDVAHILMPTALWMRFARRAPIRVVAWNHTDGSALTVDPDINRVEDLAGSTVAIPYWYSIHNVMLQQLLAKGGLKPAEHGAEKLADNEVRLVVMAPSDMPTALANKSIAGFIVAEPFNAMAELNGVGKILRFTGDMWLHHACCVVVMHENDLEKRPEWSQGVLNAIVRAQKWMRGNREEAGVILSGDGKAYLPQPREAILRTMTHYHADEYGPTGALQHPEWDAERIDFMPYPFPSYTEALVRFLQGTYVEGDRAFLQALSPADAHRQLVEASFVRDAISRVGGPAVFGLPENLLRSEVIVV